MILEKQKEANILQEGQPQDSIGMSLDLDSAQILMQMLSKNLYSDSIGSTVRECASNALDSHRRAGVDKPIIVSFSRNSSDNYEFSVEDFGIGLDAEDVKNIISKYGKSTKRNSNNELGMMGLGFKAPLAYSSSFYFVCRKDGIERKYMMYEGEDVNTIDLLYEQSTTECNGVKVIVPIKWQDKREFIEKINEQLAYFENVYFNVEGINNDFLIHRNDIFQFSELCSESTLHICLDNVYYPIDFSKLGINTLHVPVGLRFSLTDGIFPTPNRESIRYTQESKKIIMDKIAKLADYMIEKYNESITVSPDVRSVFDYYSNSRKNVSIINKDCEISDLLNYSVIKVVEPKIEGIELLDLKMLHRNRDYMFNEYEVKYELSRNTFRDCKNYWNCKVSINTINDRCYIFTNSVGSNKKLYLKHIHPNTGYNNEYKFIKKVKSFELGNSKSRGTGFVTYYELLQLELHPKSEWRQRINEFIKIQNMFLDGIKNLEDVVIDQAWLDSRKKIKSSVSLGRTDANGKRIIKLQGEIIGKVAVDLEKYNGNNCKFVSHTLKLEEISKLPYLIVYTSHDESKNLNDLYELSRKQKIKFMTFSQREMTALDKIEIHNLIKYEKFMEGKNKPFKRIVTSALIYKLEKQKEATFSSRRYLKDISTDLYDKLEILDNYQKVNYRYCSDEVLESMITIAEEHNLFDHEVYHVYKEVKEVFEKLPFLNSLMYHIGSYYTTDDVRQSIVDLMKYYKYKVNLDKYNIRLNEEIVEPVDESLIEQLID